jgi:NAD(P)H-nitrite reductase large subunit
VCHCLAVAQSEILAVIRSGAATLEAVGRCCEAGTGCQSCHEPIRLLLQQETRRDLAHSRTPKCLRQLSLFDGLIEDGGRKTTTPLGSHKR